MNDTGSRKIAKNALLNTVKHIIDVIFPLITFPYVARTLGPESYGKVEFANSIVGYFVIFALFGVTSYAIREGTRRRGNREEFSTVMSELFTLNLMTTFIAYVVLLLMITFWQKILPYRDLILLLSTAILFTIIGFDHIYTVYEEFAFITVRSLVVKLVSLVGLFLFVKKPEDYYIYALILVISTGGANIFNFFHARKYADIRIIPCASVFHHLHPMAFFFLNSLMVTIYVNSDITVLGMYCSNAVVGMYGSSAKIYNIIKRLINAITAVVIPQAIVLKSNGDNEKYRKTLSNLILFLSALILPAITGLFFLSDDIILLCAGEDYFLAQQSLRILCFSMPFAIISNLLISVVSIPFNQERKVAITTCVSATVNILLNLILIPRWGQNAAALTTVFAEIVVFFFSLRTMISLNVRARLSLRSIISVLVGCLLIGLVCNLIKSFGLGLGLELILSISASVVVYCLTMIVSKNEVLVLFGRLLKRKT